MSVKFFGQYLVENGVITRDDLLQAIELQERKNLKLGEMAIKLGYVTQADITRAHNAQLSKDMKLGDLLLEMRLLSREQLDELLVRQKKNHLYIGEALVLNNSISSGELQRQLDAFKADQAAFVPEKVEFPMEVPCQQTWEMSVDLTYKMITRVLGMNFRPGKCRVAVEPPTGFLVAAMDFSGDVSGRYLLSVTEELRNMIARAMLREDNVDDEPVEVLEDTVMEFVNIVCGNIAAKASQGSIIMDINPPFVMSGDDASGLPARGRTLLCFPILVGEHGNMDLYLYL